MRDARAEPRHFASRLGRNGRFAGRHHRSRLRFGSRLTGLANCRRGSLVRRVVEPFDPVRPQTVFDRPRVAGSASCKRTGVVTGGGWKWKCWPGWARPRGSRLVRARWKSAADPPAPHRVTRIEYDVCPDQTAAQWREEWLICVLAPRFNRVGKVLGATGLTRPAGADPACRPFLHCSKRLVGNTLPHRS